MIFDQFFGKTPDTKGLKNCEKNGKIGKKVKIL